MPPPELGPRRRGDLLRISVFMNVFDRHVNRAPVKGQVVRKVYSQGAFLNAELDKAGTEERAQRAGDRNHPSWRDRVVQIAGLVARRILCWTDENDRLDAGERFGLIRFGSRLDVFLPASARALVSVGQTASLRAKPCWRSSVRPRAPWSAAAIRSRSGNSTGTHALIL